MVNTPFEDVMVKDGVDLAAVEGAADMPYEIPNIMVDWQQAPGGVPTLWWRSVGHSHTAFVVESFLDELAHAASKRPVRISYEPADRRTPGAEKLSNLRLKKRAGAGPLPEGHGRGLAVHESFGSFVAEVAEVSVSKEGKVKVHRVVCAIDCGPVVNPETIHAQMEGGVVFGLTAALYGEITFEKGRVKQSNFNDYPMLRINEMPVVETYIVESADKMGGIGEPGRRPSPRPCATPSLPPRANESGNCPSATRICDHRSAIILQHCGGTSSPHAPWGYFSPRAK